MRTRQRTRLAFRPCCTLSDSICRPPAHAGCRGDDHALRIPPPLQQMRLGGCRYSSARMSLPCPVDRRMCTAEVHSSGRPLVNRNWHTCVTGEERAGLGHAARYAVGIQQSAIWEKKKRSRRPAVASRRECRRPQPRGRLRRSGKVAWQARVVLEKMNNVRTTSTTVKATA